MMTTNPRSFLLGFCCALPLILLQGLIIHDQGNHTRLLRSWLSESRTEGDSLRQKYDDLFQKYLDAKYPSNPEPEDNRLPVRGHFHQLEFPNFQQVKHLETNGPEQ